ncbi:MAG TPA: tetratricopeptide repeat protein [Longimicrobium sp.]|jgi:predicted negative regulator of RcsB-dependent stress response|nr:tetratricopeptide repeat protein [Longimicrobium sp.]
MASPSVARRTSRTPVESDDVVMMRAAELAAWAQKNTQAVIIAAVLLVATLGGIIYYRMYSGQRAERAASAFLNLQASMGADTAAIIRQLETFGNNYDGTTEAAESRILAAQLWLARGDANKAVAAVRPAADGGTPVKEQAKMVLASAIAASGKRAEAIDAYLAVAKGTKLAYLKQDALGQAAALREQANDWKGAAELYAQAIETTEEGTADRALLQLHLSEAQAHAGLPVSAPK